MISRLYAASHRLNQMSSVATEPCRLLKSGFFFICTFLINGNKDIHGSLHARLHLYPRKLERNPNVQLHTGTVPSGHHLIRPGLLLPISGIISYAHFHRSTLWLNRSPSSCSYSKPSMWLPKTISPLALKSSLKSLVIFRICRDITDAGRRHVFSLRKRGSRCYDCHHRWLQRV